MFDQIVHEWSQWVSSPRGSQTLAQWAIDDHRLRGWTVAELASPLSSPRTDRMQAALVRRAQDGQHCAVLALITQLRPGLISLTRWWATIDRRLGTLAEAEGEVLATFGVVLMSLDLERRPEKIAASLVLGTRQRLWRAKIRQSRSDDAALAAAVTEAQATRSAPEDMAMELDLANAVTTAIEGLRGSDGSRRLTAELAYRAWVLDQPGAEIARDLGIGPNMVRTRLCRLRSAVRDVQAAAA
ncbi:MAG: hypothetical protein GY724_05735 [Actinomycetia bacterium]|nr:hypothetical protein [Actinomycetes bacterium]MCP4227629.1 hypothetical protein [Actinomycetes bacterium]MCP5032235.1 hypothetical protein [Actinomycetes bacterium]